MIWLVWASYCSMQYSSLCLLLTYVSNNINNCIGCKTYNIDINITTITQPYKKWLFMSLKRRCFNTQHNSHGRQYNSQTVLIKSEVPLQSLRPASYVTSAGVSVHMRACARVGVCTCVCMLACAGECLLTDLDTWPADWISFLNSPTQPLGRGRSKAIFTSTGLSGQMNSNTTAISNTSVEPAC